ncbi:MAG: hypothetical protein Kow0069_17560 [Promethearchaeota archaeon]
MGYSLDGTDRKLLRALVENSRVSLKSLAIELKIRPNSIYQRLQRLQRDGVIKNFTVTLDPAGIGLVRHRIFKVWLSRMMTRKVDKILLESTCTYLSKKYPSVMFAGITSDDAIYLLASFTSERGVQRFEENLKAEELIGKVESTEIVKVEKGQRLFQFGEPPTKEEKKKYFDDTSLDEEEDEEESGKVEF